MNAWGLLIVALGVVLILAAIKGKTGTIIQAF